MKPRRCVQDRDRAGGGAGGALAHPPPPPTHTHTHTFLLYKIKIKESSNKIEEEIPLVRNGVKLQFNVSKTVDADIANIKSNVSNDNY